MGGSLEVISKNIKVSANNHLLGYIDLLNQKGYNKATVKTTEFYIHLTSKTLQRINNPLDNLEI